MIHIGVAPRAGAWIETFLLPPFWFFVSESRPARARGLKQTLLIFGPLPQNVAPRAGAWIETWRPLRPPILCLVAPRAGAWIETFSLFCIFCSASVAPRAGAWIETYFSLPRLAFAEVAPRAGAWIETFYNRLIFRNHIMSRPARARGLKLFPECPSFRPCPVAPRAGAWIETIYVPVVPYPLMRRAPRGRVD